MGGREKNGCNGQEEMGGSEKNLVEKIILFHCKWFNIYNYENLIAYKKCSHK